MISIGHRQKPYPEKQRTVPELAVVQQNENVPVFVHYQTGSGVGTGISGNMTQDVDVPSLKEGNLHVNCQWSEKYVSNEHGAV